MTIEMIREQSGRKLILKPTLEGLERLEEKDTKTMISVG